MTPPLGVKPAVPDTWHCPGKTLWDPCSSTLWTQEHMWPDPIMQGRPVQTCPILHPGLGKPDLDPDWWRWSSCLWCCVWGHEDVKADTCLYEAICTTWTCESPIVQIRDVDQSGPEVLQQDPGGAERHSFGKLGGEEEPDRLVVGEADVAMRPIGHVLYKPLHVCHGEVMDMERSSWITSVSRGTKTMSISSCTRNGEIKKIQIKHYQFQCSPFLKRDAIWGQC